MILIYCASLLFIFPVYNFVKLFFHTYLMLLHIKCKWCPTCGVSVIIPNTLSKLSSSVCDFNLCFPVWPRGPWRFRAVLPERPLHLHFSSLSSHSRGIQAPQSSAGKTFEETGPECLSFSFHCEFLPTF